MPALNRGTSFSLCPAAPVNGPFLRAVLVQVNHNFLARHHGHVARPDRLSLARYRDVVRADGEQQVLMPNPVVIEVIYVADEISRRRPIREYRRAGISLEFNVSVWTGDGCRR